ncbi:unnamed protein product [Lymnaea stagnalis]|uniref:Sulfatase N-terminal domain-containing protein n=1 Tax=Lymnaea stagnalis TaxID=6523 RepID=A0AAV2HJD8_LYMST
MTGLYPFRLGLQHLVIYRGQPVCVPTNRTFLPQVLKQQGYATHMIGKWHLGFCKWECTPTYRGFDSFFGYYNSMEDYYNKTYDNGYDFRDGKDVYRAANGTYSSYLYTERMEQVIASHDQRQPLFLYLPFQNVHEPLEVPKNYSDLYPNIKDEARRTLSGMVTALDDAVGSVVAALKKKGLYEQSLIVFTADNGGWVTYGGNNYPLRGGKFTVFEGGTRSVAFVHSPMFGQKGFRYDGLMHMVDWFPTLVEASGSTYTDPDQDGVSQWSSLQTFSTPSKRQEVVYNLDLSIDPIQGRAAIRVGDFKLVAGFPGLYPDWYKPGQITSDALANISHLAHQISDTGHINWSGVSETLIAMEPPIFCYLFNVTDDPTESKNIYDKHPDIVQQLEARLAYHKTRYVPPDFPPYTPEADPSRFGGVWTPGWC